MQTDLCLSFCNPHFQLQKIWYLIILVELVLVQTVIFRLYCNVFLSMFSLIFSPWYALDSFGQHNLVDRSWKRLQKHKPHAHSNVDCVPENEHLSENVWYFTNHYPPKSEKDTSFVLTLLLMLYFVHFFQSEINKYIFLYCSNRKYLLVLCYESQPW